MNKSMATALVITRPDPLRWIGADGQPRESHSGWYFVRIQDGLQLFGLDGFWVQRSTGFFNGEGNGIPGLIRAFRTEWNRPGWPKIILDDGGWLAEIRGQARPSFKNEAAVREFLLRNLSEAEVDRMIRKEAEFFLGLNVEGR